MAVILLSCTQSFEADKNKMETPPEGQVPKMLEKILELNSARIGNSQQIVLAINEYISDSTATVQTFEKINGQWVEKYSNIAATVGKKGFAPYNEKREGDKKAPTGVFFLGPVYHYPAAKVTTKMENWVASNNDYWIDDTLSPQYNRWVTSNITPKSDGVSCEVMKRTDIKYKYGIAVQYNMDQVKYKGSVITIHVKDAGKATAGCVAIPEAELVDIISWLDPAKKPLLITGNKKELLSRRVSAETLDKNDKYIWKKEVYPPAK
jgi:L,D-peptidoglycan transpeptidase YkuD (ErfK/YbiS/YcfS/YnhG family)